MPVDNAKCGRPGCDAPAVAGRFRGGEWLCLRHLAEEAKRRERELEKRMPAALRSELRAAGLGWNQ